MRCGSGGAFREIVQSASGVNLLISFLMRASSKDRLPDATTSHRSWIPLFERDKRRAIAMSSVIWSIGVNSVILTSRCDSII